MKGESLKTWAFRTAMNWYPMFFGTGGKVIFIKSDWHQATVRLKLNLWTRNYVGTIFGGSMFSAVDPFHIVLLINIMGKKYVIWDKAASIRFKKPGKGTLKCDIGYTEDEIKQITAITNEKGSYEFTKPVSWIDQHGETVATVEKTVYVATKEFYKLRAREKVIKRQEPS